MSHYLRTKDAAALIGAVAYYWSCIYYYFSECIVNNRFVERGLVYRSYIDSFIQFCPVDKGIVAYNIPYDVIQQRPIECIVDRGFVEGTLIDGTIEN